MKKKISYLFMVVLIACSLIMPCVADEPTTELVTEITTELVTEVLEETTPEEVTEPTETPTEGTEDIGEVIAPPTEENATDGADLTDELEQIKDMVEKLTEAEDMSEVKELISSSSTWVIVGAGIVIILAVCGIVKKKFGVIINAFNAILGFFGKVKNENGEPVTLNGELKDVKDKVVKEIKEAMHTEYGEVSKTMKLYREELKNREENEQKLYAMFSLFMTNVKMSESAKKEILAILMGIKKYDGDPFEIVAQAQEAIENAKEEAPATPTLDQMLDEDYMDLG